MDQEPDKILLSKKDGKGKKKDKQAGKEKQEIDPNKKLYLRFPHKLPESIVIKEMHPLIKNVVLPRQKSARFCFVEFESESDAQTAMKALKDFKTANGKQLFLSLGRKAEEAQSGKVTFRIQRTGRKNVSL
ncbi:Hypothetical predicted protein [Cloeon dipterum]|uniref:RRM domain-containing protein n=1 Tax=Cloeon dipterum TaxID=197152 RepID=A0A8S1CGI4_9INSE|nr:Hypothetical predicted protein [Cloeon dipterum]